MIQMIITDLDNTLIRSDRSISDYTVNVLEKCRAKGIKIVYATARSKQAASRFFDRFTPDIFIGYGGALILAGETVIHRFDIPADISAQLIEKCLRASEISRIHATNEAVAHTNIIDPLDTETTHYQCVDFSSNKNISYLKISLTASTPAVVEGIAFDFPMLDVLRYTGEDLYRLANRDATKWNAVKTIGTYLGISTENFVAFGDDVNDVEMIKNCGIGVAVENAIDEVRAVANCICGGNDNDGIAKWLEENVL